VPSHSPWIRIGCGDIFPEHVLGQSFQVVIFAGKEKRFGAEVPATDDCLKSYSAAFGALGRECEP
jgi:hypothetical protein